MTENETKTKGNPKAAFELSRELLKTLKESELFRTGSENKYVVFDIMMGIAEFTDIVLTTAEIATADKFDLHDFYTNTILASTTMKDGDLASLLKNLDMDRDAS